MRWCRSAKSDTSTSKLASGGEKTRDDMERGAKQKAHIHSPRYAATSLSFTHTDSHTTHRGNAQQSADNQFTTYPQQTSVRNHITVHKKHNAAARCTMSKEWERHYTAPQSCVVLGEENNQRSTHPSIQREGRIAFPIFPLIWGGNELVWKTGEGEVERNHERMRREKHRRRIRVLIVREGRSAGRRGQQCN